MEVTNKSGRRKTSVARVYLTPGKGEVNINGKSLENYFPLPTHQYLVNQPFAICECEGQYDIKVNVDGGGISGQADAVKLAIAKALVEIDEENKPKLRAQELLTRDPRMVERKKFGQKKARKKFQFSKR